MCIAGEILEISSGVTKVERIRVQDGTGFRVKRRGGEGFRVQGDVLEISPGVTDG